MRHIFTALLLAISLFAPLAHSESVPHPGPRSPEEEAFLYQSGMEAIQNERHADAIRDLKRLIERYPSTSHLHEAYFSLLHVLLTENQLKDVEKYARQVMALKLSAGEERKAKIYLAHALFGRKQIFESRTLAEEVLKNDPPPQEKSLAMVIRFLTFLDEKEYAEAKNTLNLLEEFLTDHPYPMLTSRIPEFKMKHATRTCITSRLLKNKAFTEEEIQEYFSEKNLCMKEAWVYAPQVKNQTVLDEWCTSLNSLTTELKKIQMDKFLREKINKEMSTTRENTSCHEPKEPKIQKHHRKRNVRKSRSR